MNENWWDFVKVLYVLLLNYFITHYEDFEFVFPSDDVFHVSADKGLLYIVNCCLQF